MEIFGGSLIVLLIIFNALSFFGASEHQKRLYDRTASDTEFNKSAHQNN